ncbi:MAG: biotin/lipoyl-binding protein [Alistipes sp.]|nr:biotin/lipoyl-binding protein [Alistipes sp.]
MKDYSLKINGYNYDVQIDGINESSTVAHVIVNGTPYEVEIVGAKARPSSKSHVSLAPSSSSSAQITPASAAQSTPAPAAASAAPASGAAVKSPLPGTVLALKVNVGDTVSAGQTLLILEAMKMENNIDAPNGGVVKQILVQQGATVAEGDNLIVIE